MLIWKSLIRTAIPISYALGCTNGYPCPDPPKRAYSRDTEVAGNPGVLSCECEGPTAAHCSFFPNNKCGGWGGTYLITPDCPSFTLPGYDGKSLTLTDSDLEALRTLCADETPIDYIQDTGDSGIDPTPPTCSPS